MNEIIRTGIESIAATEAVAGAAVGYAIGQVMEARALKNIDENRVALMHGHENVGDSNAYKPSKLMRTVASLAVMGTFSGYAGGQALRTHNTSLKTKPTVELAVDHSFEVRETTAGGNGSVKTIDQIAATIMNNKDVQATAYIAHGEASTNVKSVNKLKEDGKGDTPSGSQSLVKPTKAAIDGAFGNSSVVESASLSSTHDRNAAVVVLTDGNSIGPASVVIKNAQESGNIPIFIADTGSSTKLSDVKASKDLKTIASQTGGKYWHVGNNTKDIEKTVSESLSPKPIEVSNDGERYAWGFLSLLAAAETVRRFRTRSRQLGSEEPVNS